MIATLSHLRSQSIAKQNRTEQSEAKQSCVISSLLLLLLSRAAAGSGGAGGKQA